MKKIRIFAAIIAILYAAAFCPAFSSSVAHVHEHSQHEGCNHEHCHHEGCNHEHCQHEGCNHEHCHHEGCPCCCHADDNADSGTGENAEFGRGSNHDHDNCMACEEYFNVPWRLPETVVFMRNYSFGLCSLILLIVIARVIRRGSSRKDKEEAAENE